MSVYFVYLRRPRDFADRRNDPFWEFGSFGKTGCHDKNLLHPRNSRIRDGDRLAFLQGGHDEIRVVGLTPSVQVAGTEVRIELRWNKTYRPIPFLSAPLLINNARKSAFPSVYSALRLDETDRSTFCGAAASRLRSRSTEVNRELAQEIIQWFTASGLPKITAYPQAIEATSGAWCRHAVAQRWASKLERANQYSMIGLPERLEPSSDTETFKPKRRC
jgi:hypothetical protein